MAVTQYVGARYVPVFADPLEWSNTRGYEPLTIVLHNSNSYTSRQAVPVGIDISNESYWALTGNFNAQIQGMQQQINALAQQVGEIGDVSGDVSTLKTQMASANSNISSLQTTVNAIPPTETKYMADTVVSYQGSKFVNTVVPQHCVAMTSGQLTQPLPILAVANTYMNKTSLQYGNDYTAMNVNSDGTEWELASEHQSSGKMNIDCATFCLLCTMGIQYASSSYSGVKNNAFSNYINMFDPNTIEYMNYEISSGAVPPQHKRLLVSEWAKLLYDNGMLQKINSPVVNRIYQNVGVGDVLFFRNDTTSETRWNGISHCALVIYKSNADCIMVMESSEDYKNGVGCRLLTSANVANVYYKFTPPQYMFNYEENPLAQPKITESMHPETPITNTFTGPGFIIIKSKGVSNSHTVSGTINGVAFNADTFSLYSGQNKLLVCPGGMNINITHSNIDDVVICESSQWVGVYQ